MKIPTATELHKYSQEKRPFDIKYRKKDVYFLEKISVIYGLIKNAKQYKEKWYASNFRYVHQISDLGRSFPEVGRALAEEAKEKGYSVYFDVDDACIIRLTYKDFE